MDASLIKKKETLTHERIRHDLLKHHPTMWPLVCSILLNLCVLPLLWCTDDPFVLFLALLANGIAFFAVVLLAIFYGLPFYHLLRARTGRYTIEVANYDGASYNSRTHEYRLHFSVNRKGKRYMYTHRNHRFYTWSDLYCLSADGVVDTYAEKDDLFYIVTHGKQIVMVYNTKLFELET